MINLRKILIEIHITMSFVYVHCHFPLIQLLKFFLSTFSHFFQVSGINFLIFSYLTLFISNN